MNADAEADASAPRLALVPVLQAHACDQGAGAGGQGAGYAIKMRPRQVLTCGMGRPHQSEPQIRLVPRRPYLSWMRKKKRRKAQASIGDVGLKRHASLLSHRNARMLSRATRHPKGATCAADVVSGKDAVGERRRVERSAAALF